MWAWGFGDAVLVGERTVDLACTAAAGVSCGGERRGLGPAYPYPYRSVVSWEAARGARPPPGDAGRRLTRLRSAQILSAAVAVSSVVSGVDMGYAGPEGLTVTLHPHSVEQSVFGGCPLRDPSGIDSC